MAAITPPFHPDGAVGNGTDYGSLFDRDTNSDGTYDIELSDRFAWVPESDLDLNETDGSTGNNCENGSNCDWDIKRFRPVYIGAMYFDKHSWYPGEAVFGSGNSTKVEAFSVWVFDYDETGYNANMLPQSIIDSGPINRTSIQNVMLYR